MSNKEKLVKHPVITESQFDLEKINAVTCDYSVLDCYHISSQLSKSAIEAEKKKSKHADAFRLLCQIARIHDNFDNPIEPYGPMLVMNGKRTIKPEDLEGEQTSELVKVAGKIKNNVLRARVADIAWLNDRQQYQMAKLAIDAYCTQIEQYFSGDAKFPYDENSLTSHKAFEIITRALTISNSIKGNKNYPDRLINLVNIVYERSLNTSDLNSTTHLLKLFLQFGINDNQATAETVLKMFENRKTPNCHRDKNILIELEKLFRRNRLVDESNDCLIQIAECSVKLAEEMSASSMASASWIMTAIEELKLARGPRARDRYRELRKILREKQEESIFELQSFSQTLDIRELVRANIERQKKLTLGHALGDFASLRVSTDPIELREEAIAAIQKHPMSSMFESSQLDNEGKVISRTGGSTFGASDAENDVILTEVSNNLKCMRNVVVSGGIEPIRRHIQTEMRLTDKALFIICENSPFIPRFHKPVFLLGFSRFFLGDMISAGNILLPQFENSLRYLLKTAGTDTSTIESDSTQVDRSISQLLKLFEKQLIDILGEATVFEIDLLFNSRKGPALRHEIAHGKFPSGHFYSDDVIYGCWFVFRITCMPLFSHWDKIADEINEFSPISYSV